jgi:hypothetical protein
MKLQVPPPPGWWARRRRRWVPSEMPPLEHAEKNYYTTVDPVSVKVSVDPKAPKGAHKVPAKFTYYYCVAASGFCAPERATLTIPLQVR